MTRINADLDPRALHRRHLVAEYRELPMVHAALRRALRTKDPREVIERVPAEFTLGRGHVSFFYDKLYYLQRRYNLLVEEMLRRGYRPDPDRYPSIKGIPIYFFRDWAPTMAARRAVVQRIAERVAEKPWLYT